jgi:hypothetical protein
MRSLGLGNEIPATAFFDGDGKLVARVLGELDKPELEHRIEWMLGKHHGKEPAPFVNGFEKNPDQKANPRSSPTNFLQIPRRERYVASISGANLASDEGSACRNSPAMVRSQCL